MRITVPEQMRASNVLDALRVVHGTLEADLTDDDTQCAASKLCCLMGLAGRLSCDQTYQALCVLLWWMSSRGWVRLEFWRGPNDEEIITRIESMEAMRPENAPEMPTLFTVV